MPSNSEAATTGSRKTTIEIRDLEPGDIVEAFRAGVADFLAAPRYGLFFGAIYAGGGLLILFSLIALRLPFLAFPMAAGFALIAPFVAGGLYEVSRRLERGLPLSFSAVLTSVRNQASRDLGWMALVTTFAFYIWIDMAGIIYLMFFGLSLKEPLAFVAEVFGTAHGWTFLLLGCGVGAVVALIVFSITAISFPLLHDRDLDFVTAMVTSVKTVFRNPIVMGLWCLSIVVLTGLAFLPAFLGLLVAMPILGHTTWHVYRRAVALDPA